MPNKKSLESREIAYRRGWQQGYNEAVRVLLHLLQQGYDRRIINQLIAIYNDHVVAPWRGDGLQKATPPPDFNLQDLQEIAKRGGYDWMLIEEGEVL
jgi:hypothetical protein